MKNQRYILSIFGTLLMASLPACGRSNAGATVSGTVTMDGKPLSGVEVTFHHEAGRPASGVTDGQGSYTLRSSIQTNGTAPGKHLVYIQSVPLDDSAPAPTTPPIKIPDRYSKNSELTADVRPGANTFNFSLESK